MRLTWRAALSLLLGLGGIVMMAVAASNVLDAGTCGSGGPYEIAQACPDGAWVWDAMLPVGLMFWFAGLFVSEGGLVEPGAGQIVWVALFLGGGIASLVNGLAQDSLSPGSELACYLIAGIFIPMGLGVAIAGIVQLSRRRRVATEGRAGSAGTAA